MNNLESNFHQLPDVDPPNDLHKRIMKGVQWTRVVPTFLVVTALVFLGIIASFWHAIDAAIEADLPSVLRFAWEDFELSWSYIWDFATIIWDSLPYTALLIFLLMVALGFCLYRLYRRLGSLPLIRKWW